MTRAAPPAVAAAPPLAPDRFVEPLPAVLDAHALGRVLHLSTGAARRLLGRELSPVAFRLGGRRLVTGEGLLRALRALEAGVPAPRASAESIALLAPRTGRRRRRTA